MREYRCSLRVCPPFDFELGFPFWYLDERAEMMGFLPCQNTKSAKRTVRILYRFKKKKKPFECAFNAPPPVVYYRPQFQVNKCGVWPALRTGWNRKLALSPQTFQPTPTTFANCLPHPQS